MGIRTGNAKGRPKGASNKITTARQKKVEATAKNLASLIPGAFDGDSHDFLMAIYKDPLNTLAVRLDAAKAAIAYEKPRLAAIQHKGDADNPVAFQIVSGVPRQEEDKPLKNGHAGAH